MTMGRKGHRIFCRAEAGFGITSGLARRGTMSFSEETSVIVVGMDESLRHVTKPVCDITMGLRSRGIQASVLILSTGMGPPQDLVGKGGGIRLTELEVGQMTNYGDFLLLHFGNVRTHVVAKAHMILRNVNKRTIIICQCPVEFEDFALAGVKTKYADPEKSETLGEVVGIVTDIVRGIPCPPEKIDEIAKIIHDNE